MKSVDDIVMELEILESKLLEIEADKAPLLRQLGFLDADIEALTEVRNRLKQELSQRGMMI